MRTCLGRKGAVGTEHSLKWAGQRVMEGLGVLWTFTLNLTLRVSVPHPSEADAERASSVSADSLHGSIFNLLNENKTNANFLFGLFSALRRPHLLTFDF